MPWLNGPGVQQLYEFLGQHLAVAEKEGAGNYLAIPIDDGPTNIHRYDPTEVARALVRILTEPDIAAQLSTDNLGDNLLEAFRRSLRLQDLDDAIASLENLLDSNVTTEHSYQTWCQRHSWIFGNAYVLTDAVRRISNADDVDLLLPIAASGLRDLVELKRPDFEVLAWDNNHHNYYFTGESSKAIGQCHRYLDVFQEFAANGLLDHPEIQAYHPRALIVIGRSSNWTARKVKALHGLNQRMHGITVMTYDQLLANGKRQLSILNEEVVATK